MKLHVFPPSPRATKVMALARHLGLDCEIVIVDLFKGEQHAPAFGALNANHKMPVLEDGDFVLWESNAILAYLGSKKPASGVWPSDARGQADVTRWLNWESAHWTPACAPIAFERIVKKLSGQGEPDPAEIANAETKFHALAPVLDGHLAQRKWLLGERLTVADFCIGGSLALGQAAQFPLAQYGNINAWYARFREVPGWKESLVGPMT